MIRKVLSVLVTLAVLIAAGAVTAQEAAPTAGQTVFALTTGQAGKTADTAQLKAASWLVQGLLSQCLGSEQGYSCVQVRSEAPDLGVLPGLDRPQTVASADALALAVREIQSFDLTAYSTTQAQNAYKDTLQRLTAYIRDGMNGGNWVPPTDVWWIDWYDVPLTLAAGSVIPSDGEQSDDPQVNVYLGMKALLDLVPELQFHFVLISKAAPAQSAENEAQAGGAEPGSPLAEASSPAELLRSQPEYAGRVSVDTVSTASAAQTVQDVRRILQAQLRAIVDDTANLDVQPQADTPGAWTALYHYAPVDAAGSALLFPPVSFGSTIAVRQIAPLPQAQDGAAAERFMAEHCVYPSPDNPCFILLKDIPAGDYRLDLTAGGDSAVLPEIKAYKLIPAREVALAVTPDAPDAASGIISLYRDAEGGSHTLTVETDAVDIPADQWTVELLNDGTVLPLSAPAALQPDAGNAGTYKWTILLPVRALGLLNMQAQLTYMPPDAAPFTLRSEPVSAQVVNRGPEIADGAVTEYPLVVDLPLTDGNPPLTMDLNTLFLDPDGDPLTFSITSAQEDDAPFAVEGNLLVYDPGRGSKALGVSVRADDGNGAQSTDLHLSVRQESAGDALLGLRFLPDMERMEHVSAQDQDVYSAITGTNVVLAYRLAADDPLKALLAVAAETRTFYGDAQALLDALTLQPDIAADNGSVPMISIDKSLDAATGDLLVSLRIEPQYRSAAETVQLDGSVGGMVLPDLFPRVTLMIGNSAPALRGDAAEAMTFTFDIQDYPWQTKTEQLPASAIFADRPADLSAYFTDLETPEKIFYTVSVTGTANYRWTENGEARDYLATSEPQEFTVRTDDSGGAVLPLTLLSSGDLALHVTAHDEEFASQTALSVQISVRSLFVRLLWIVGVSALAVCLLLAALLIIRRIRKPAYGELQIAVAVAENGEETAATPVNYLPLKPYKKRGITLYALLLAFQLPPLRRPDAAATARITLYPTKKGIAALTLQPKTPVRITPAQKINRNTWLLTENRVEITAEPAVADAADQGSIVLFFRGGEGTYPDGETLWE